MFMQSTLTIALAQCNVTVGDLSGNAAMLRTAHARCREADLLVAPEMALIGYPAEDLVLRPAFQDAAMEAVRQLARDCAVGPALLVGGLWRDETGLHNAAFLLEGGEIAQIRRKHCLPNDGVFDEARVFKAGPAPGPMLWRGLRLGVLICEDLWHPEAVQGLGGQAVDAWIVVNASPYEPGKQARRMNLAQAAVARFQAPLIYLNLVGGQDELVFDGASFALDANGACVAQAPDFEESFFTLTLQGANILGGPQTVLSKPLAAMWRAAVLGTRDYIEKGGHKGVLLGLSGGVDSAVVAAMAVDALGADRVLGVLLPSIYTSDESRQEALEVAHNLGIETKEISIAPGIEALTQMLAPHFDGMAVDTTEENLQSRLRGVTLMALSNKLGCLLLTTGNKSEMAVGYATLYGDMCGAFNPLKDVYKTRVYDIARWRNSHHATGLLGPIGRVIPEFTLTRAPSAELRPDQTDQDSLPPYDVLDAILERLIEGMEPVASIARDFDPALVARIARLLHDSEYKRRQAPPGPKLTIRNFGRDRRMPITDRFVE